MAQDQVGHRREIPMPFYLDGESSRTRSINLLCSFCVEIPPQTTDSDRSHGISRKAANL